ncbi:MAG: dihydropteroate synthase [Actinobacteria bacterium]|jgi:dihydropteroate synthase|nr:dihydropteroate synthase [Actinomycetota bacterium]
MELIMRGRSLLLDRCAVMGVLNVTPDSFSDGGLWFDPGSAVAHAKEMMAQGADIIDVGGESTRPGSERVSEDEEIRRVMPVIEALVGSEVPISIDTRKPLVAKLAVEAGADIVNDTSGEESDPAMGKVAAETGAAIIVMHSRGTPATMRSLTDYADVVNDVGAFLARRAKELQSDGVGRESIVLDPGYGFAKTPVQNLAMLRRIDEHLALGYPLLVGTSRKSFIGAVLDLPEGERLEGTAATVVWAVARGAQMVRVHDVEAIVRTVRMTEAIRDEGDSL